MQTADGFSLFMVPSYWPFVDFCDGTGTNLAIDIMRNSVSHNVFQIFKPSLSYCHMILEISLFHSSQELNFTGQ